MIETLFSDEHIVVVDKPAGMLTHPAKGTSGADLVSELTELGFKLAPSDDPYRPGIVHRLDRQVSGLLVCALSDLALKNLAGAFKRRDVEREYIACVAGQPQTDTGTIEAPIGSFKGRRRLDPTGRHAVTHFSVIRHMEDLTLLSVRLETGRTHQIRLHLASIGLPIVGDSTYGAVREGFSRPFLHAHVLGFLHPATGVAMRFVSELPKELAVCV